MTKCIIDKCNADSVARGLCHRHYKRWQLHGHTNLTNGKGCDNVEERLAFQSKRVTGGCLEWTGPISKRGYGQTKWNYKFYLVHRLVWILVKGPIPKGLYVCHHCDNRKCLEITHLFIGTASDNRKDCIKKGRANVRSGKRHPNYKHGKYVGVSASRRAGMVL